jgi:hypothetical protein
MKTKSVLRHYCEFCGKGSFKKPSMIAHEASCTLNSNRVCFLCEQSFDLPALIAQAVKASATDECWTLHLNDRLAFNAIYHNVENCPACMLSILRQSKVMAFELFDYRKEKLDWMNERHREAVRSWG